MNISSISERVMRSEEALDAESFPYNLPNRVTVNTGPDVGFKLNKRPSLDTWLKHRKVDKVYESYKHPTVLFIRNSLK